MKTATICLIIAVLVTTSLANLQAWSEITYLNRPFNLFCNFSDGNFSVTSDHNVSWTKLGSDIELRTDEYYELQSEGDVPNMILTIRTVTEEMSGIYFCSVKSQNGSQVARGVKGLNIAGHLYDEKFDEYKTNVIRGVISAAAVFTIVVGICLIDRFRYLTEDQKEKRRNRERDRQNRLHLPQNGGVDNMAMQDDILDGQKRNISLSDQNDSYTRL